MESDGEGGSSTRRRIQWAEDVVDNEGLGRKTSKGLLRVLKLKSMDCRTLADGIDSLLHISRSERH